MPNVPDPPWWSRRTEAPRDKRPLTRELIVDAALVLLERDGLQGLSMRRLAQELDSGAASLYWHVGDKEELLNLLLDRIVGETPVPEPDPENWQGTVKELARAVRKHLAGRRDAAQLSLGRVPAGPNALPILERNLAVLAASPAAAAGDRLRRGHVRALHRRVRLRGEPAACAPGLARAAGGVLRLAAAGAVPDAHAAVERADRGRPRRPLRVRARPPRARTRSDGTSGQFGREDRR